MKQQFTERSVYGGISEDDKLKGKAQVLYSENLDLTTNSDFYNISQAPETIQTFSDNVLYIFEADNKVFVSTDDGNLYKAGTTTPVWTGKEITSSWVTSEYLYMVEVKFNVLSVFRISLDNISQSDWAPYITTTGTESSGTGEIYIVSNEDTTYLGLRTKVFEIENAGGTFVSANIYTIDTNIVGMSTTESNIHIFTESGNYIIRDGVAGGTVRIKDLGTKIGHVENISNQNYIITGGAVYILNGYNLELINKNIFSDILYSNKYNIEDFKPGKIAYSEGIFYAGVSLSSGSLKTPSNEFEFGIDNAIMTYGIKKKGMPTSANLYISRINGVTFNINYLYYYTSPQNSLEKKLYIGYVDDNGVYGVATLNMSDVGGEKLGTDGILVYEDFDGGLKEAQKSLLRIKLRADINNSSDYIYLCTFYSDGRLKWFNGTQENSRVSLSDLGDDGYYYFTPEGDLQFYNIAPALVLYHDSSNRKRNTGIKVYSLTYEYDFTRQG